MALGDGIRRNIAHVEPSERAALKAAIIEMHTNPLYRYSGSRGDTPPGGVSWWFKQDEIHQSTHVHRGPEFVPWHREFVNRFEGLLRQINPQLSLHYWDFKEDPRDIPNGNIGGGATGTVNLFDSNFMGSSTGSAGDPWLSAGFYDPTPNNPANRDVSLNPVDPPPDIRRTRTPAALGAPPAPYSTAAEETSVLANVAYPAFRSALENLHNLAHVYYANVSPHNAFRDPFVFLLHSNIDRLYAQWQTDPAYPGRLDTNTVYGAESNLDVSVPDLLGNIQIQNLTHLVEPWSTGNQISVTKRIRPWEATHENQGMPHDYHHISVVSPPRYDTNFVIFGPSDRHVFDAEFYLHHYPDLAAAFGTDLVAARNHWLNQGLPNEGRRGSREFDVQFYLDHHGDLKNAFGTNYTAAFDHWLNQGLPNEGRRGSREFHVAFYLDHHGDLKNAFGTNYTAAFDHWLNQGLPNEGRRGSREFHVAFYLDHHGDLKNAFGTNYTAAFDHWLNQGLPNEGRRGSREFHVAFYLDHHGDLKNAFGTNYTAAFDHWLNQGLPNEGRRGSREFHVAFYLDHHGDLKNAFGTNYTAAFDHWLNQGLPNEGRRGSREFHVAFYLDHHGDLKNAFGTNYTAAFDHWLNQGLPNEGRAGAPEVDLSYYLSNYNDLQLAFGANYQSTIDHWITQGLPNEGRRASLAFDVQYYLATYPDLQTAFGNNFSAAFDHWVNTGISEGRKGAP